MKKSYVITENLYNVLTKILYCAIITLVIYYIQFHYTGIKYPHLSRTISEISFIIGTIIILFEPVDIEKKSS